MPTVPRVDGIRRLGCRVFPKNEEQKISRARMMREIAEELTAEGILVTQAKCDNKWKALLTSYRTAEDHN